MKKWGRMHKSKQNKKVRGCTNKLLKEKKKNNLSLHCINVVCVYANVSNGNQLKKHSLLIKWMKINKLLVDIASNF